MLAEVSNRCNAVEDCYEFMLAYAAHNLNASIHLRALLTDLFLVDEILKKRDKQAEQVVTNKGD